MKGRAQPTEFPLPFSTLPILGLLLAKAQGCKVLWKPFKPCHIGIHWIALPEFSHVPGFQSFFRGFHHFVLAKSVTSSISRVNTLSQRQGMNPPLPLSYSSPLFPFSPLPIPSSQYNERESSTDWMSSPILNLKPTSSPGKSVMYKFSRLIPQVISAIGQTDQSG